MRGAPKATSRPPGRNASAVSSARPAERPLQVQGHDELEADVGAEQRHRAQVRPHERAERRMPRRTSGCGPALDRHEGGEQRDRGQTPPARASRTSAWTSSEHAGGQQHRAGEVVLALGAQRRAILGDVAGDQRQQDRRDGHGEQERQAPVGAVNRPPKTSPKLKPLAPNALKIASALLRDGPSENVVVISESAAGDRERRRGALDEAGGDQQRPSSTSPPAREASVKTASAPNSTRRGRAGRPRGRRAAAGRRGRARRRRRSTAARRW